MKQKPLDAIYLQNYSCYLDGHGEDTTWCEEELYVHDDEFGEPDIKYLVSTLEREAAPDMLEFMKEFMAWSAMQENFGFSEVHNIATLRQMATTIMAKLKEVE